MHKAKFTELGVDLYGDVPENPESEVAGLENLMGASFPPAYRSMLVNYGGALMFDKEVAIRPVQPTPWDGKDGTLSILMFYGAGPRHNGIASAVSTYEGREKSSTWLKYNRPKKEPEEEQGLEKRSDNKWVIIDYYDVVVHVMHRDQRQHYDLDTLWSDAPQVLLTATTPV